MCSNCHVGVWVDVDRHGDDTFSEGDTSGIWVVVASGINGADKSNSNFTSGGGVVVSSLISGGFQSKSEIDK